MIGKLSKLLAQKATVETRLSNRWNTRPTDMTTNKISTLFFLVIVFSFTPGCHNSIPSIDAITNTEDIAVPSNKRAKGSTILYLMPTGRKAISSDRIQGLFLTDWKFQYVVTISGYTATDDLWTIMSSKSSVPYTAFDLVRIELTGLKIGTADWKACMEDVCVITSEMPRVIVLDQDLEAKASCRS